MTMANAVWINGRITTSDSPLVAVDDGGFLHGAGLFETMRAENGRVFRLEEHMRRLMNSAARLLFPVDRSTLPSDQQVRELLGSTGLDDARVRLTLTPGPMSAAAGADPAPTVVLTAAPLGAYDPQLYRNGVRVLIARYRQSVADPLAGHKTTSYLSRLVALREAQASQSFEALWFTTDHRLAEGSISNVFVVRDQRLLTPPADTPVLPGIARRVVLEIADVPKEERALTVNDLLDADEIFLTNSIIQIMPVVAVERHTIGDGKVGPVTTKLRERFKETVRKECHGE